MSVADREGVTLADDTMSWLFDGALPDELAEFEPTARNAAKLFVAAAVAGYVGQPVVRFESVHSTSERLVVVDNAVPFLVQSVVAVLTSANVVVRRLLHPVIANGAVAILYLEIDALDDSARADVRQSVERVLTQVRASRQDLSALRAALAQSIATPPDSEGAALMRWFLDGGMVLLGHRRVNVAGQIEHNLGTARVDDTALMYDGTRDAAIAWFEAGHEAPLLLKADARAEVYRREPYDLVVVPRRDAGRVVGLDIHAGLWTAHALAERPEAVPRLRVRLDALEREFGFASESDASNALRSALQWLPLDLLAGFDAADLRALALTAMSIADRPRPKLALVDETLGRQIFAFVWLPRDALTPGRREAIGAMIAEAIGGVPATWGIDLGDGDMALLRYTIALPDALRPRDVAALDARLNQMVRGWAQGIRAALARHVDPQQAARLAASHAEAFPPHYRDRFGVAEAAADILALVGLGSVEDRAVRLHAARGEGPDRLRLKVYRTGGIVRLSDVVPVLEHFGFVVLEEAATTLDGGLGHVHQFSLEAPAGAAEELLQRAAVAESAIAEVLQGFAENDAFNRLIVDLALDPQSVVLLRAWFRYLRQTGLSYGLATVANALARAGDVTRGVLALFAARHDPARAAAGDADADAARATIEAALVAVSAIDDDRILRRLLGVVEAIVRTNVFAPAASEALAFKLDSARVPDLPAPRPWRETWVYSPRVEGIHLRGGPVARGGLRWSDRRDDFRVEILGLMKAQVVKNAVIVPTGAKGGFYPKQLPAAGTRSEWLEEGKESYRIFIRALLSITDNIVGDTVTHPPAVRIHDGTDPYFVVAADKGTASFSDVANAIAIERGFWLGDAFASGGSVGYDHKAMGITAKGAWVSVTRHFAEAGVDVQADPILTVGCGDMSGDVFGNGMLLSKSIKLVAAFDHRHIFLDPTPDSARSWDERARLFALPSSSWSDYDSALISAGGGVYPRSMKAIAVSAQAAASLGIEVGSYDPGSLIQAILRAPVDLLWFGGIGTYVKAATQSHAEAGDPANDALRIDAEGLRTRVIGEGANLAITQAGRIAFARRGGRINTDFIDNSAGVDCSDNEVNIKIALGTNLSADKRSEFLAAMTDDVAAIVLDDNHRQTLALSLAERGGAAAVPAQITVIEALEAGGRLDRMVEGLDDNVALARRAQDDEGLTRPELAVLLSHTKLALKAAVGASAIVQDPTLTSLLTQAFPAAMQERFSAAIERHRLRGEILTTRISNRVINTLGLVMPFELAEAEGVGLAEVAAGFLACDTLLGLTPLFDAVQAAPIDESARLTLLDSLGRITRRHLAEIIRIETPHALPHETVALLKAGVERLDGDLPDAGSATAIAEELVAAGAPRALADRIARLHALDGVIAIAATAAQHHWRESDVRDSYTRLGEVLELDWALVATRRLEPAERWERLLVSGLTRDFRQIRLDFIARAGKIGPDAFVADWLVNHDADIARWGSVVRRARAAPAVTPAMLALLATQARLLLDGRRGTDMADRLDQQGAAAPTAGRS